MRSITIGKIELLDLERAHRGLKLYCLATDHRDDDFDKILVPQGFITNGASVPPLIRKVVSPTGAMFRAAVVHDYLYYSQIRTRRDSDKIFSAIVFDDTGSKILSLTAYMGLRCFGRKFWKNGPTSIKQIYLGD